MRILDEIQDELEGEERKPKAIGPTVYVSLMKVLAGEYSVQFDISIRDQPFINHSLLYQVADLASPSSFSLLS